MTAESGLCPWLGLKQDREIRYTEPSDLHRCHAQGRPAGVDPEHQQSFCLGAEHLSCRFYREPPEPQREPVPTPAHDQNDEVGPLSAPSPLLRWLPWLAAAIVGAVVIFYYASTLATSLDAETATPGVGGGALIATTATHSPTPSPTPAAATAGPTYVFAEPTGTPTPYPGGSVYSLLPEAGAAGWVAGDEQRGNHLGDSYLYSGVFDGIIYHGILQFDLSPVPRGATIHAAVLELAGLDARRMDGSGVWEVRILDRQADVDWSLGTYQSVHNAAVQWTLSPALGVGDLVVGQTNAFELSREQSQDLADRLLEEHYTVSFRIDGPLAGGNSVFAWDTGYGPATQGRRPQLLLNVGPAPVTPIPSGSPPPTQTASPTVTPTPTETPVYKVIVSTPTPGNAVTAAAVAAQATVWATTTGTATPLPDHIITATPDLIVVTNTPTPRTHATAVYRRSLATANAFLTGTPTPTPPNLVTATSTPRPTRTPVMIWLDQVTPLPTPTPTATEPPLPAILQGMVAFLSDRSGREEAYVYDPETERVALLTDRWPYDLALKTEHLSPDGQAWAFVQRDGSGLPQVYVQSDYYRGSWQVTFNTGISYGPVWSPAGEQLAFVSTEAGNDDIYVINTDSTGQERLTINIWEWDKHPSWSPDGSQIVYWSNAETGRRQIWIMDADGTRQRILSSSPYNDWDPVWIKSP